MARMDCLQVGVDKYSATPHLVELSDRNEMMTVGIVGDFNADTRM
jgi:hypothetical protein